MDIPFIITIKEGVVDTATASTEKTCQQDFLAKVGALDPERFKVLTGDDIDDLVADGYYAIDNESVCLTWIDVPGVFKKEQKNPREFGSNDENYTC